MNPLSGIFAALALLLVAGTATGWRRDFDGVRVDDGAEGSIYSSIRNSTFNGNLADGVESDERGDGDPEIKIKNSDVTGNAANGVKAKQADAGEGSLLVRNSDPGGNSGNAVGVAGVQVTLINTTTG